MQSKILVIEDDMKIRKVVTTYLKMAGYDVTAVADGAEGLQIARGQRFDLLVLDLNLPSMGGMEIAAQLGDGGIQPARKVVVLGQRDLGLRLPACLEVGLGLQLVQERILGMQAAVFPT